MKKSVTTPGISGHERISVIEKSAVVTERLVLLVRRGSSAQSDIPEPPVFIFLLEGRLSAVIAGCCIDIDMKFLLIK